MSESAGHSRADAASELWRDRSRPAAERVADLLARMSLREKVAQLYGLWETTGETGPVTPAADEPGDPPLLAHGLGQLTRPYGTAPVEPLEGARALAARQQELMRAGRFGIPAIAHEECLTGVLAWQATVWPNPLCWAASFDPGLVEAMARRIGSVMRSLGLNQGLAPVMDVVRDLRWGRVEETMGEDPHLVGTVGSAYVRELEHEGIVATLKHFAGYSASRAGRNLAPVSMGPRELADVLLVPFEMALKAGARSVMAAYTDLDGIPAAASRPLLSDRLREEYGFTGTVVADYNAIRYLQLAHGVAPDAAQAAASALRAGVDVELPHVDCYGEPLVEALIRGEVDESLVDRAATRVLLQKCELGLLDADWRPGPAILEAAAPVLDDAASRHLARELARRSITLLKNAAVLPLDPGSRLAVVGPRADAATAFFGCYAFPVHVGAHHPGLPMGIAVSSVVEALRADPAAYDVSHAPGCSVAGGDDAGLDDAAAVAERADVCVVVLGDEAGLFGRGTSGEGCDAADLRLPGRQEELLERVLATGTPTVVVLLVGRPYNLSRQMPRLAAALCAFFPGEEGGPALADILSGRVNPSGHLPVSFPGADAGPPSAYLTSRLGRPTAASSVRSEPLFAFGHGLSYAPAVWEQTRLISGPQWPTDSVCELAVTLFNRSERATSEVVQAYLHDPVAEVVRPVQQLVGFVRVDLAPGQRAEVRMCLHADLTSFTGLSGERIVEPGDVTLEVGASSADIRASLELQLHGPRRRVGFDRRHTPDVAVETMPP